MVWPTLGSRKAKEQNRTEQGMAWLKVAILGPKIGKKWGLLLLKFVRGHVQTPLEEINYFSTYRVVWQSFAKIGPGTSKIWWTKKK